MEKGLHCLTHNFSEWLTYKHLEGVNKDAIIVDPPNVKQFTQYTCLYHLFIYLFHSSNQQEFGKP